MVKEKACFKCSSDSHFIKDCPLSKQDTNVLHRKYTNHNTNTSSTPDKVMEPLTRLFTYLIEQLMLLTPLGHKPHNGHPIYKGNGKYSQKLAAYPFSHRQHGTNAHHKHSNAHRDHKMTKDVILTVNRNDITGTTRTLWVITGNMLQSPTPGYMGLSYVANVILSFQLPLTLRNTWMRKMFLHQTCQKLVFPPQDLQGVPENLRGSAFCEKVVRHPSSLHILQILVLRLKMFILEESLTMSVL